MANKKLKNAPKRNFKEIGDTIFVVCEGYTEVNYLKGFKQTLSRQQQRVLKIEPVKALHADCMSIVNDAIKRKKTAKDDGVPYKEIWVFFDDDNQAHLQAAFKKAKAENIHIAFSSICLEFWFLLHFKYSSKQFGNATEAEIELKTEWNEYCKPAFKSWEKLESRISTAISNSQKLRSKKLEEDFNEYSNPYTNVDCMLASLGHVLKD